MDAIDTTGSSAGNLRRTPELVAYWKGRLVLYYITGGEGTEWAEGEIDTWPHRAPIDQAPADDPHLDLAHVIFDSESGAIETALIVELVGQRHSHGLLSTVYLSESGLVVCRQRMKAQGVPGPSYVVANWNLSRAEALARLGGDVVGVQFASADDPRTAGEQLPGGPTGYTLKDANVDLSVFIDGWPTPHPAPAPVEDEILVAKVGINKRTLGWAVMPAPLEHGKLG
jgi:hypothetical protein